MHRNADLQVKNRELVNKIEEMKEAQDIKEQLLVRRYQVVIDDLLMQLYN